MKKRGRHKALAVCAAVALLGTLFPVTAHAVPQVGLTLTVSQDGTPDWDADDNAGNDSGPTNGIVRVNDTITYRAQYNANDSAGGGVPVDNVTVKLKLPRGLHIDALPAVCSGPGSALNPSTLPNPTVPLTANSINELPEQELICNLGTKTNASDFFAISAKVSNLVGNGQQLTPISAEITADGATPAPAPNLPRVTTSSRLKWDISKNSVALKENLGYIYGPTNAGCPWNPAKVCKLTAYTALLSAPAGGKGAMPAIGDIAFTDDLSPRAMYPGLEEDQYQRMEADLEKYGSRIYPYDYFYSAPAPRIGFRGSTAANAVRDSGQVQITQEGPGKPAKFVVKNADTSLITYPSEVLIPAKQAIPGNSAYAVAASFQVYTPIETIREFGAKTGNTWTLATKNAYTELDIKGFDPGSDVETLADQPTFNDYRSTTPNISIGNGFSKYFAGVPGEPMNTPASEFSRGDSALGSGLPGNSTYVSGGTTVAPDQKVQSQMLIVGTNPGLPGKVSAVVCDSWDNTRLHLEARDVPRSTDPGAGLQQVPSNGAPVWISGYNNVLRGTAASYAQNISEVPTHKVQYSATPGGPSGASECGDAAGPWYDTPEEVPGNDQEKLAQGIYTGVGRVRVHVVIPEPVNNDALLGSGIRMVVATSLRVAVNDLPDGDILPNYASVKRVNLEELTMEQVLNHATPWGRSYYDKNTHRGQYGDRVIKALSQVRINKQVRRGTSGDFGKTPPQVTGSSTENEANIVQWRLKPSLTSPAAAPGLTQEVWVEDCLPAGFHFVEATRPPTLVVEGSTPGDSKLSGGKQCGPGSTYLRWVLPDQVVNADIPEIIVTSEVSPTASDGVYQNTVQVWADGDHSLVALRQDAAEAKVTNIAGVKLEKLALTPVVQANRGGQATDEVNRWRMRMTNTLPNPDDQAISDPVFIDVLPRQGLGESNFNGTFSFVEAEVTKYTMGAQGNGDPAQVKIQYTSAADVAMDPNDPSNGAAGSTTWCDAPAGGQVVSGTGACPADASEVTGLRITKPGAFTSGHVIEVELTMKGVDNAEGDVYSNVTFGRATGLALPVGPIKRNERVVAGTIGDHAWFDLDNDGIQDQGEPPASGITVKLTGTDDLGNAVSLTTTTDDEGHYQFANLRAAGAGGYVVTFEKIPGATFTTKGQGDDRATDSNVDAEGVAEAVQLGHDSDDPTVDAGYVLTGALQVRKIVSGVGVETFAPQDEYRFTAVCTLNGAQVLNQEVTLAYEAGRTEFTSEELTGIPVGAECVVTETATGDADPTQAAPTKTVTIAWNKDTRKASAIADLTNYYSAGQVSVTKVLEGDDAARADAEHKYFRMHVTCVKGDDAASAAVVAEGDVVVVGAATEVLKDEQGQPVKLPLGARCYATETADGGAVSTVIDHKDFDSAVKVEGGGPDALVEIGITVTNTFKDPRLSITKNVRGQVQRTPDKAVITYDVVVTNDGEVPAYYALEDTFAFGEGITIDRVEPVTAVPDTVVVNPNFDGVNNTFLAFDEPIEAGERHTFSVTVETTVPVTMTTNAADCTLDEGEQGTGLRNAATLAYVGPYPQRPMPVALDAVTPAQTGQGQTATACKEVALPRVEMTKEHRDFVQDGDKVEITYDVVVTNPSAVDTTYSLTDTLKFGEGVTVDTARVEAVKPVQVVPLATDFAGNASLRITENQGIAAGTSHTFTVKVTGTVAETISAEAKDCEVQGAENGTGLLNVADVTWPGGELSDNACEQVKVPGRPKVAKEVKEFDQQGAEATIAYEVTVTNPSEIDATYTLADELRFGEGVTITEVEAVTATPDSIVPAADFNGQDRTNLVTDQVIPAGARHVFTVRARASVATTVTAEAKNCELQDAETGTGLLNQAIMTTGGEATRVTACEPVKVPGEPQVAKVVKEFEQQGQDASIAYEVTVTNPSEFDATYSLNDELRFGEGVSVVPGSVAVSVDPAAVTPKADFDGVANTTLVTDQAIPAGARHVFTVRARASVATTVTAEAKNCELQDAETGTGLLNQATMTSGGKAVEARACEPVKAPGDITMTKRAVAVEQDSQDAAITYEVTVTNPSEFDATYSLNDELRFGEGVSVVPGSVAVSVDPAAVTPKADFDGVANTTLVTDQAIKAGATHTFTVKAKAKVALDATAEARECELQAGETGTGLLNQATMTSGGKTVEARACEPVRLPAVQLVKTHRDFTQDNDKVSITYDVKVTNTGDVATSYSLTDTLRFGPGITVDGVEVTAVDPADVKAAADFDGRDRVTLVTDQRIDAGASHTFTITVTGTVAETISAEATNCELRSGETGTGLLNGAVLTWAGGELADEACEPVKIPGRPQVNKVVTDFEQQGQDASIAYEVTVTNPSEFDATYSLNDELRFGEGVTVVPGSVTVTADPADIVPAADFDGVANPTLVTDQEIKAGATHTYTVKAKAKIRIGSAATALECELQTGENGTGLLNRVEMVTGGQSQTARACRPVEVPDLQLSKMQRDVAQDGASVAITYDVRVTNTGGIATSYSLADTLAYGDGIEVSTVEVSAVDPADVKAAADFDGQDRVTLVTDQRIDAGASHTFTITVRGWVTEKVTAATADCEVQGAEWGTGLLNMADLTWIGGELSDRACEPVTPLPPKPEPTPSPSPAPSPTPTVTPSPAPSPTPSPAPSPRPTPAKPEPPKVRPGLPKTGR
ncbi:MAG: SdrD B-like domain-containing protein [Arachnia propionica]|nr:SdrD B-like domain-containing protein [Arachnia propionica]